MIYLYEYTIGEIDVECVQESPMRIDYETIKVRLEEHYLCITCDANLLWARIDDPFQYKIYKTNI